MERVRLCGMVSLLLASASLLTAQEAPPAEKPVPRNMIGNGSFEQAINFPNLYDGIDAQNNVRVPVGEAPIYTKGASFGAITFAPTVSFVDVNGDGIPDLEVASCDGHLFWYPNTGTKTEPAFDHGRMVRTRLGWVPHLYVCDWNGDGKQDVLFGSFDGLLYLFPNLGTSAQPKWVEDDDKPRWLPSIYDHPGFKAQPVMLSGGKTPLTVGTYAAPCFVDWNKDGLNDIVVGEGGYSANSVRVWLNTGSRTSPVFKDENMCYIAYGEGREQLTPSVWDWNNDGIPDLITGDRQGQISVHLGTREALKDPKKVEPIPLTKFLSIGGVRQVDGNLITPYVCDFNGDGMPDILFGTVNGKIKMALGKGSREDPELDVAREVKGVDFCKDFKTPAVWQTGESAHGQMASHFVDIPAIEIESEKIEVKDGKNAFHLTWFEKFYDFGIFDLSSWYAYGESHPAIAGKKFGWREGVEGVYQQISPFMLGKDYEFSYWSRGENVELYTNISYRQDVQNPDIPKGGGPPIHIYHNHVDGRMVSKEWSQFKKVYTLMGFRGRTVEYGAAANQKIQFKNELNTNDKLLVGPASVSFVAVGEGDFWLDDVKLIPVGK
jgi:hypothetical protein